MNQHHTEREAFTQFDYLLNAFEQASQADKPAEHGYGGKRKALYAYVRDLESRSQQPATAVPADMVQLVGVRNGIETVIGTATMPPKMKARELVLEQFGTIDEEAGDDGAFALWACESLIDWMEKNPPAFNVTSPAAQAASPGLTDAQCDQIFQCFTSWFSNRSSTDYRTMLRDAFGTFAAAPTVAQAGVAAPKLQVWYGAMPESNGKSNFTAILHKGDLAEGHTIARSEYPDRVRYFADHVRYLLGEIERPDILAYDEAKHSGYVEPATAPSGQDAAPALQAPPPNDYTKEEALAWLDGLMSTGTPSLQTDLTTGARCIGTVETVLADLEQVQRDAVECGIGFLYQGKRLDPTELRQFYPAPNASVPLGRRASGLTSEEQEVMNRALLRSVKLVDPAARFVLDFRPSSEIPPLGTEECLLLNPCDGFHIMEPCWLEGEFQGFRPFASTQEVGPEFYVAWAALPDSLAPQLRAFDRRPREEG